MPENAPGAGGPGGPGALLRVLLYGHPVGHSLSPAMHAAAFRALGVAARYDAVDVPPERLPEALERLRAADVAGANLTVPHKEAALRHLDELSEAALAIGAVNTVVNRGGRLLGTNTDGEGFVRALTEGGIAVAGADALVLGAGGAARAVVHALLASGAERVGVWNRTAPRAARLAADLERFGAVGAVTDAERSARARGADLIVNTTTVGMHGAAEDESPLPAEALPETGGAVVDIVYRPPRTPLLAAAQARGLATQNGVGMLLHQGAAALELWLERPAPVGAMRTALLDAL